MREGRETGHVLKAIHNKWVLRACLNEGSVLACRVWLGREFQSEGAGT